MMRAHARLKGLAYRMLGSVADAEDVVQDAYEKLRRCAEPPRNEEAWLFRVVANLAVDRLRWEKVRREAYVGPWLPEPVTDASGVAELAEDLSIAFLFMLERLTPAERVVFVLHEGFDLDCADIGSMLELTPAAARQRLHRARRRLAEVPAVQTSVAEQNALLDGLLMAVAEDDVDKLIALLHPQAVGYTDGGGVVSAALIPVADPRRIAQVTLHLVRKASAEGGLEISREQVGSTVYMVVRQHGVVHSVTQVTGRDGRVGQIFVMRNPQKLAAFAGPHDVN